MKTLPFKGRIWRQGTSFVVTIPSDYVTQGLLTTDKEHQFTIEVHE